MWLLFQTCWDASPCADTKEKAIANAKDVKRAWIEAALESNSRLFFDTFFELCRKFNIQYSIATTQEKAFIDEVTESIYERKKVERDGKAPTYQQRV